MISKPTYPETDPVSDPYWDDMRKQDYSKSFHAVAEFISQNAHQAKVPHKRRNRLVWILAIFLPLLVFFSCKRTTYTEPQGITLSFIAKDSVQSALDFLLQQYAEKEWKSVLHSHAGTIQGTIYAPAESYSKLKAFSEKLKALPGVAELFLSVMNATVKESPLSHLSYTIFNWHFNSIRTSDEQLRMEINTKLKETGIYNLQLQLVSENGKRQVKLLPNGKVNDFSIDLTLHDGTNITALAEKW